MPLNSSETLSGVSSSVWIFHILYRRATLILTCDCQHRTKRGAGFSHRLHEATEKVTARWEWSSWSLRERPTAESFLLCSNGKSSQEMEREMRQHNVRGERFQSNESCPPAWVQHPTCNSNIPFFSEAFWTDISKPSCSKSSLLLSSFLGIKTCTDFALSQR